MIIDRRRVMYKQNLNVVDLGFPSGILWSKTNLGAENPEDVGLYFMRGMVEGHFSNENYSFSINTYVNSPGWNCEGRDIDLKHDAANYMLGSKWRMPTKTEFQELCDNCTMERTTENGVIGMKFISKINNNSLFFPITGHMDGTSRVNGDSCGCFWSSTKIAVLELYYKYHTDYYDITETKYPYYGIPIRPVYSN